MGTNNLNHLSVDLETIAAELFRDFEEEPITDRNSHIDTYVLRYAQQQTMAGIPLATPEIKDLSQQIKETVLPAYETFCDERAQILEQRGSSRVLKYLGRTVGVVAGLTLLVTRFKLNLGAVEAIIGGSFLGTFTAYWVAHHYDQIKIDHAQNKFTKRIKRAQTDLFKDQSFALYQQSRYEEVNDITVVKLCGGYSSFNAFQDDYQRVRAADPTSAESLSRVNAPLLQQFMLPHLSAELTHEQRQQRFDQLSAKAQQYFAHANRASDLEPFERE